MAKQFYEIKCTQCDFIDEVYRELIGYDVPIPCPSCGEEAFRLFAMPGLMGNAANRDGCKRTGWEDMRQAAHLEVEIANTPPEKQGELKKEKAAREASAKRAIERKGGDI